MQYLCLQVIGLQVSRVEVASVEALQVYQCVAQGVCGGETQQTEARVTWWCLVHAGEPVTYQHGSALIAWTGKMP